MAGAMSDFGRMSVGKKVLLFGAIAVVFALIYFRFIYRKLSDQVKKEQAALTQTQRKNRELDDKIPKVATLRAKKKLLDQTIQQQERALPTEAEMPAFYETLARKIGESGAELLKYKERPAEPVESFVKVSFEIEIVGTFLQIKRFFASLIDKKAPKAPVSSPDVVEERERIVSVENLVISQPAIRNREIVLTAKFVAVTYRQDVKPPEPTAPGAVPADAPAPAPAGGPTPKASVEESLQKSEQRVEAARLQGGI